jgi:trypsin
MRRPLRLTTVLATAALAAAGAVVGTAPSEAIVGGSSVKDGGYRVMASVQDAVGHFCGGSVITSRWVLTAAHCMTEQDGSTTRPGTLRVVVGRTDLSQTSKGQTLRVDRVRVHPRYAATGTHDVALLHTTRAMRVPAIRLVSTTNNRLERDGARVTVAGWGSEAFGLPFGPSRMKAVRLSVVADGKCTLNSLTGFHPATEICADALGGDSCQGDSGGPLFGTLADGRRVQVGVVSYGVGCATPGFPGVYAEVNNPSTHGFLTRVAGL